MKSKSRIEEELRRVITICDKKNKEYTSLGQIAALDSNGQKLDKEIQEMNGRINALKWVLEDRLPFTS
jgi:peptidoglycan hydrolase CwlO-like protein